GSSKKPEEDEAPKVPRKRGGSGGGEINDQNDEEEFLAPETVGKPAEEDGAQHGTGKIGAARQPDVGVADLRNRALLKSSGDRAYQGHFQSIENPGDPQCNYHQRVEVAPGQTIQSRWDICLNDWADCFPERSPFNLLRGQCSPLLAPLEIQPIP